MSVHPVLAGVVGIVVLGQRLDVHEWTGMAVVVLANTAAVAATRRAALPGPGATAGRRCSRSPPARPWRRGERRRGAAAWGLDNGAVPGTEVDASRPESPPWPR
jgi:hypothetical protein